MGIFDLCWILSLSWLFSSVSTINTVTPVRVASSIDHHSVGYRTNLTPLESLNEHPTPPPLGSAPDRPARECQLLVVHIQQRVRQLSNQSELRSRWSNYR